MGERLRFKGRILPRQKLGRLKKPVNSSSAIQDLFRNQPTEKFSRGQIILYAGDELQHAFCIKSGYVKIYDINDQGENRILAIVPPNSLMPLSLSTTMSASKQTVRYFHEAMSDVEVYKMPRRELAPLLESDQRYLGLIIDHLDKVTVALLRRVSIVEGKDAKDKIVNLFRYLIRVCGIEITPRRFSIRPRITHQDIASLIGITRETTSIQIKKLEREGMVEQRKNGRLIINLPYK